jgi:hypothetical protein
MQRAFMYNLGMVGVLLTFAGIGIGLLTGKLWQHMVYNPKDHK